MAPMTMAMPTSHQPTARPVKTRAADTPRGSGHQENGANIPCSPAPSEMSALPSSSGRGSIRREVIQKNSAMSSASPAVRKRAQAPTGSFQLVTMPYTIASGAKKNAPAAKSVVSTFTSRLSVLGPAGVQLGTAADPAGQAVVRRGDAGRRSLGVVEVEGGALGADPRQREEVVPRRRAGRRPLERASVAPRVVDLHLGRLARHPDVVQEEQHGAAEDEGPEGGDPVVQGEPVLGQVVGVPAGHPLDAEPVLDEERGVEPHEGRPEVDLAEPLVEHPPGELRPP